MMSPSIESIVLRGDLSVAEKAREVNHALCATPDRGWQVAVDTLRATDIPNVASFAANHLALFGGRVDEVRAVFSDVFRRGPEFAPALANLVRFLDAPRVEAVIDATRRDPSPLLYNLAYEVATWFPHMLREHFGDVTDPLLRLAMLSGGPNEWIAHLCKQYVEQPSESHLDALGRFHTRHAGAALLALRPYLPREHSDVWRAALHGNGCDEHDGRTVALPAMSGFIVDEGATGHRMGGPDAGSVPLCISCGRHGVRVLHLASRDLPFEMPTAVNPEFFWYACDCPPPPFVNLQCHGTNREVLIGPSGSAGDGSLLAAPASLSLAPHPNPTGIALDASSGLSRHQVGGYPQWIRPEPFPTCLRCQRTMRFMAQLDRGMTLLGPFELAGILYCFWCDECCTSTTTLQQD